MAELTLRIRTTHTMPWIENFSRLGWKVRNPSNSGWIQMTPTNTKVRSADNTRWESVR